MEKNLLGLSALSIIHFFVSHSSLYCQMYKLLFTLFLVGNCLNTVFSQIPQGFSYQAVARDSSGACLADQLISLRLSIVDDSVASNPIFQELFSNVQTNMVGHFQVMIGTGALQGGSPNFEELNWNTTSQRRHLKVELSPNNDLNLQEVGMTQLLTVPYATASANGKYLSNDGDESLMFQGANESVNISLTGNPSDPERGIIGVHNPNGDYDASLYSSSGGAGFLELAGENGNLNVVVGAIEDANGDRNNGAIRLLSDAGIIKAEHGVDVNNSGFSTLRGPNGNLNLVLGISSINTPDRGGITVRDENGTNQASLLIDANGDGVIAGDIKNFFMDHPTQPSKEIWYASLEGPEAAAYERGKAQLIHGEAHVTFSDHFEIVANPATMTIMLTPRSAASKGLAVIEQTATGFIVKELNGGIGNYEIDWEAKAVRKGWEDYQVIREKQRDPYTIDSSERR